jgi:predicted dehydrogenase
MLVHVGGKNGTYGEIELYCRPERHGWMMGPHLLGSRGQMMVKPNAKTGIDEIWYCPFDVSFANQTPDWELVPFDEALFLIEGKAWPSRHTIWSIQNVVTAIREGQQPELSGKQALVSLECVSATYESHFTAARVNLPMTDRQHPLEKRQNTKIEKENGEQY